jgi:hypothetical protein
MSDTMIIATSANDEYRVVAEHDHDAESPRWGAEVGSMYGDYPRYTIGDERVGVLSDLDTRLQEDGFEGALAWLVEEHGVTCVLPLYLTDHSGLSMTAGPNLVTEGIGEVRVGGWDTSLVGCIFATAESWEGAEILGDVEDVLRAEVTEYDMYLQGRVYRLFVERKAIQVTRITRTYPDGEVKEHVTTEVVWVPVPDGEVHATYGEEHHASIAAEMLHQFEAPVSNVAAHSE